MRCEPCPEPDLLPESLPAVELYLRCQTQWVYSGMGQRTRLDYAGVDVVARRIEADNETFEDLQIIERALLSVDREKAEKQASMKAEE